MIVGVLQARTSSRRLPGKVLLPLLGQPMLARQIERLRRCRSMTLVVATSCEVEDDAIQTLCEELGVPCHRGSLDDVLDRVYHAALANRAEHVVRLTGDCPLADPAIIDDLVELHLKDDNDFTSNALQRTVPDGLDAEVIRVEALAVAHREARLPSQREHVTPFFYQQPERFRIGAASAPCTPSTAEGRRDWAQLRWVVDEPADFAFVEAVYQALYPNNNAFASGDILALLEREPEIGELNAGVDPDAGWRRSLEEDALARADARTSGDDLS